MRRYFLVLVHVHHQCGCSAVQEQHALLFNITGADITVYGCAQCYMTTPCIIATQCTISTHTRCTISTCTPNAVSQHTLPMQYLNTHTQCNITTRHAVSLLAYLHLFS